MTNLKQPRFPFRAGLLRFCLVVFLRFDRSETSLWMIFAAIVAHPGGDSLLVSVKREMIKLGVVLDGFKCFSNTFLSDRL